MQDRSLEQLQQGLAEPSALAAMTGASFAYRLSKIALLEGAASLGLSRFIPRLAIQGAASSLALSAEVSAFRLLSFQDAGNSWFVDYLHFSALKAAAAFSAGTNPVFMNALQDAAYVASHHLAYGLGWTVQPQGSLLDQFVQSHTANWGMHAAGAMLHQVLPGLAAREIQWKLRSQTSTQAFKPASLRALSPSFSSPGPKPGDFIHGGRIHGGEWEVRRMEAASARADAEVRLAVEGFKQYLGENIQEWKGDFYVLYINERVAGTYNIFSLPALPRVALANGIHILPAFRRWGGLGSLLREVAYAQLQLLGHERVEYNVLDTPDAQEFQRKMQGRRGVRFIRDQRGSEGKIRKAHIDLTIFEPDFSPFSLLLNSARFKKEGVQINAEGGGGFFDWAYRWVQTVLETRQPAPLPPLLPAQVSGPEAAAAWQRRRSEIRAKISALLGEGPTARPPLNPRILETVQEPGYTRLKVQYHSEDCDVVSAYLLVPEGKGPFPAVLALHQTVPEGKSEVVGLAGKANYQYGLELVKQGYVVLAPDTIAAGQRVYPDSDPFQTRVFYRRRPRWSAMGKMLWDHQRSLDFLETLPSVDRARIGAIGQSLGAHNAMMLAAMDERVKAVVISGGYQTLASDERRMRWAREDESKFIYWPQLRAALKSGRNEDLPFDFHEIMALILPRSLLQLGAVQDQTFPRFESMVQVHQFLADLAARAFAGEARLQSSFFDGPHDFPLRQRALAYDFLKEGLQAPRPEPAASLRSSARSALPAGAVLLAAEQAQAHTHALASLDAWPQSHPWLFCLANAGLATGLIAYAWKEWRKELVRRLPPPQPPEWLIQSLDPIQDLKARMMRNVFEDWNPEERRFIVDEMIRQREQWGSSILADVVARHPRQDSARLLWEEVLAHPHREHLLNVFAERFPDRLSAAFLLGNSSLSAEFILWRKVKPEQREALRIHWRQNLQWNGHLGSGRRELALMRQFFCKDLDELREEIFQAPQEGLQKASTALLEEVLGLILDEDQSGRPEAPLFLEKAEEIGNILYARQQAGQKIDLSIYTPLWSHWLRPTPLRQQALEMHARQFESLRPEEDRVFQVDLDFWKAGEPSQGFEDSLFFLDWYSEGGFSLNRAAIEEAIGVFPRNPLLLFLYERSLH